MIDLHSLATFTEAYPDNIARISHEGATDPLFEVPRLSILAGNLPRSHTQALNADTRFPLHDGTPPALLVQGIEGLNAEITIRAIDRDADYDALIEKTVRPLGPLTRAAGAPITEVESSICLCSPETSTQSTTADCSLIVLQCRGLRNVVLHDDVEGRTELRLTEGTAVFIPNGQTYHIENSDDVSVSILMKMTSHDATPPKTLLQKLGGMIPRLGPRR